MLHEKGTCGAVLWLLWGERDVGVAWGCTVSKPIKTLPLQLHVLRIDPAGCVRGYQRVRVRLA